MAGRIILSLCCFLCAGAYFLNGRLCRICSSPVAFWTGGETALKTTVKDPVRYNREMGSAFRWYAIAWLICGLLGALSPLAGIIGMIAVLTLGLFLLWKRYRKILNACS